jgi:hypothetical protein
MLVALVNGSVALLDLATGRTTWAILFGLLAVGFGVRLWMKPNRKR